MLPPNCLIVRKCRRSIQKLSARAWFLKTFWQLGCQVATLFELLLCDTFELCNPFSMQYTWKNKQLSVQYYQKPLQLCCCQVPMPRFHFVQPQSVPLQLVLPHSIFSPPNSKEHLTQELLDFCQAQLSTTQTLISTRVEYSINFVFFLTTHPTTRNSSLTST